MQQERIFDNGRVKLNCFDGGVRSAAPSLVMLHGGAWCWQEFLSLIPALMQCRRVCALDLRGNGKSGWTPGRYCLEDFAGDTAAFVEALDSPVILLGHSLGGVAALMTAARCPEAVKAVVIEDAPLSVEGYRRVIDSSRDMFTDWLELKKSAQSEEDLAWLLAERYKDFPGVASQWILFFAGCLRRLDPAFFDALLGDPGGFLHGYDPEEIFCTLTCPVLAIRGEERQGAVITDKEMAWLKQAYPCAACAEFTGAGHLLHLQEQYGSTVLAHIKTFLNGI